MNNNLENTPIATALLVFFDNSMSEFLMKSLKTRVTAENYHKIFFIKEIGVFWKLRPLFFLNQVLNCLLCTLLRYYFTLNSKIYIFFIFHQCWVCKLQNYILVEPQIGGFVNTYINISLPWIFFAIEPTMKLIYLPFTHWKMV